MPFLSSMMQDSRSGVDKTKKPPDGSVGHDEYYLLLVMGTVSPDESTCVNKIGTLISLVR
jgi:hypothetical protein